ncbi:odorant receptor 13a-like isoform X3 [Vespula squamosa]|uniref:Odorant receptor 13a-like isoform X3 n=1 Tax=Vespula squamosa TaxID=30214 RepID=A0ABD2BG34_VESSQ
MENMLMFMTLTKFVVCRMKWQPLAKFLAGKENDHIIHNYKTKGERLIFTKYKKIATKFIVITIPWVTLVLFLHYFKAVIPNILMITLDFLLKQYYSNTSMGGIKRANGIDKRIGKKEVSRWDEVEKKGTGPGWNK